MMKAQRWLPIKIQDVFFDLLNLDHPQITARIVAEMETGFDVYYDQRWAATELFACYLQQNRALFANKSVLVLGAGVGLETLVLGRYCKTLYINDLSALALTLCNEQLQHNHIATATALVGDFTTIELPTVDIIIGAFLIYNQSTLNAIVQLLQDHSRSVLLMNEKLRHFRELLNTPPRPTQIKVEQDSMVCVLFASTE